ncbi:MAG: ABC transporter substrate-binding protein [Thermoleophilia bacterium]
MRAAAALALSGRFAPFGRQAARGLRAWAQVAGADLVVEDDRSDPRRSADLVAGLSPDADLTFGPYGSGAGRAVRERMAARPEVIWNHGAAALARTGPGDVHAARVVDVLGPAESYWRGLPAALAAIGAGPGDVLVARAPGGFGEAVAAGAVASLTAAGASPEVVDLDPADPSAVVDAARGGGRGWVAGGGRAEDDLALGRALARAGLSGALVVCGVGLAGRELGGAVEGWLGPAQWDGSDPDPPARLPPDADYPAAQALAAGLIAERALRAAGSRDPDDLWDAARGLRTRTFLGPFAVDAEGRQTAHAPVVVRWRRDGEALVREVVWRPAAPEAS